MDVSAQSIEENASAGVVLVLAEEEDVGACRTDGLTKVDLFVPLTCRQACSV